MSSHGVSGLPEIGERVSLRERVAESLRAALVSGRMAPGTTYSIPALAEQFGVSATPVREAMLDLVNEGIVAPVPNKGFRVVELTDEELDLFLAGVRQAMRGDKPKFNPAELGEGANAMFQERFNAKAGKWGKQNDEFLVKLDADKSITKTASGLRYKILTKGSDVKPTAASTVKCRYEGKLVDGKVFDSTKNRNNEPSEFPLSGVIPAWTEGVQLIGVGGKIVLYCPSAIAYGDQGQGPIPGKSVLEFEVELVEISKAK